MKVRSYVTLVVPCALFLGGCSGSADESSNTLDHWLGATEHLAITGTQGGETTDIRVEGEAARAAGLACVRTYKPFQGQVQDANGNWDTSKVGMLITEFGLFVDIAGEKRYVNIQYWRHDPMKMPSFTIIPRQNDVPVPPENTWLDVEWYKGDGMMIGDSIRESSAESGPIKVDLNDGVPDQGGVYIPTGGTVGGFISADWGPQEHLSISFTAPCGDSEIHTWGKLPI